ncbi:hypothetical protein ANN_08520 [Periplaneta americana]|uniref:RNase H type-1 domain-containing protein n=1 Tax=Periplaneta americana TaxID=6978 RepID=A0ABQ8T1M6_PERAM|nr:hypothetical protein ANN_08520 [Periplaneta americana]
MKAHAGCFGNELADQLAKEAASNNEVDISYSKIPKSAVKSELKEKSVHYGKANGMPEPRSRFELETVDSLEEDGAKSGERNVEVSPEDTVVASEERNPGSENNEKENSPTVSVGNASKTNTADRKREDKQPSGSPKNAATKATTLEHGRGEKRQASLQKREVKLPSTSPKVVASMSTTSEHWANYLRKMKKYREEGREIVYVDETWVDSNLTHRRCWQSDDLMGVQDNMNLGNRLIIHARGASGFLAGAELIYKAGSTTGDYHGQMNSVNFQKWVVNQLMPNLQPNSVVVLDNAPYHCIQVDKAPSPYALKGDMIEWLRKKGVKCNETIHKNDLYKLILPLKPKEKTYRIDNMLSGSGHVVIRLPPYMCDLNAIELAWSKIKRTVRDTNVTADLSLTKLRETTKNAIQEVTRKDWAGFCHHVANLEAEYWEKDGVVPDVIDLISINLNTDSDSEAGGSDSENGSSSSEESV